MTVVRQTAKPIETSGSLMADTHMELRLYIAKSTPNSVRAQQNLEAELDSQHTLGFQFSLEVIDVFTNGKRAISDGVIVTPTLIITHGDERCIIVGDLSDRAQLRASLMHL